MIKADFHIHTSLSDCSTLKPTEIIQQSKLKGLNVIGVVDHNNIKGGLLVKKLAKGITVIPGEEIKTNCGDLIIFNSDGKYSRDLIEICERAKQQNHFVYAPHPFDVTRNAIGDNINKITKYLNAVEVFNSRCISNNFNVKAEKFAKTNKITGLAGSDSHFRNEIGGAINYIEGNKFNLFNIKVAKMECKKGPITANIKSHISMFRKRILHL